MSSTGPNRRLWAADEDEGTTAGPRRAQGSFDGSGGRGRGPQSTRRPPKRTSPEELKEAERAQERQDDAYYSSPHKPKVRLASPPPQPQPIIVVQPQQQPVVVTQPPQTTFSPGPTVQTPGTPGPPGTPGSTVAAAVVSAVMSDEERLVRGMAGAINDLLQDALLPMLDAVSAVAYKLGENDVRRSLVWMPRGPQDVRSNPLEYLRIIDEADPELTTMSYLIRMYESKLGRTFIMAYLEPWIRQQKDKALKLLNTPIPAPGTPPPGGAGALTGIVDIDQMLIGSGCFAFQDELSNLYGPGLDILTSQTQIEQLRQKLEGMDPNSDLFKATALHFVREKMSRDALRLLNLSRPERKFAPAWAFDVISSNIFRAFVAPAHLVAFELAHAQIVRIRNCESFTLKELICSKGVADQFAWMVAYQYMDASKGLPMHRPKGERGERGIYVNINHMRETVQKRAYLCRIWFESVRAYPNPVIAEFEAYRQEQDARLTAEGKLTDPAARAAWEASMTRYREMLPARELKYTGH